MRARSLTARLLVGVLLMSGLALATSLAAGVALTRDYLYQRAGDQVVALAGAPRLTPRPVGPEDLCDLASDPAPLPSDFRVAVIDTAGSARCAIPAGVPGPATPSMAQLEAWAGSGQPVVVSGGRGGPWSTAVRELPDVPEASGIRYVVVAISLEEADRTARRLALGGAGAALAVLLGLALVGHWVIRVGLRPLTEVREAARGIRHGDLSARVPGGDRGTEVAELATVLNEMLGEIEQGFEERRAAEARIRQFAADASHELRTPLTSIKGYAQLHPKLPPGERDDLVRRIDSEADRMTAIVEDLLLLVRLDRAPGLTRENVDLVEVAHDVLSAARARYPDRRLDLDVSGPVVVSADRGRVIQVLGNLVTNALVHTPGSVTVRVAEAPGEVRIEVADEGPGMTEEVREHVFDRFFRADAGRSHETAGSGLGLSIVRALVEAHGGSVVCESSPETGSRFTVTLARL